MRTLALILLLASPVLATSRLYQHDDAQLNDELDKIYHDLTFVRAVNAQASTGTFTYLNVSTVTAISGTVKTLTGTQLNYTTGTVNSLMVVGTATNDSAPAGRIGEYPSSYVSSLTNFPTTNQYGDLTSISLTAGDWDVSLVSTIFTNGATVTEIDIGMSTTSGNSGTGLSTGDNLVRDTASTFAPYTERFYSVPVVRMSLTVTTTIYLKYLATYSVAIPQARGRISARRVR